MSGPDPVEGMARAIVLAAMPGLAEALGRGVVYWRAAEALVRAESETWAAHHGQPVADRAATILRCLNCATVLTPYGRDLFLREYPLKAIPSLTPPEANGGPLTPAAAASPLFEAPRLWRRLLRR